MGFTISYKTLFEIKLLHHYFLDSTAEADNYTLFDLADASLKERLLSTYDSRRFVHIQPTEACKKLLRQYKCVYRQWADKIVVAIKSVWDEVTGAYRPEVPLPVDLRFLLQMEIVDPNFQHYTNIPLLKDNNAQQYFFENKSLSGQRSYPYLTKWPPQQTGGTWYHHDEILVDNPANPGQLFIAQPITGTDTPSQTFTTDPTVEGSPLSYVNRNDWLVFSGSVWTYNTGLVNKGNTLKVNVLHPSGVPIAPRVTTFEQATTIVQIPWDEWAEGVYTITLEDSDSSYQSEHRIFVYKTKERPQGIIQIEVTSDDTDYNLLAPDGTLLPTDEVRSFTLRFKNRSTHWRYLGQQFSNEPESGPHPLTQHGFVLVAVPNALGDTISPLPNPGQAAIKAESTAAFEEYYKLVSEIYINS